MLLRIALGYVYKLLEHCWRVSIMLCGGAQSLWTRIQSRFWPPDHHFHLAKPRCSKSASPELGALHNIGPFHEAITSFLHTTSHNSLGLYHIPTPDKVTVAKRIPCLGRWGNGQQEAWPPLMGSSRLRQESGCAMLLMNLSKMNPDESANYVWTSLIWRHGLSICLLAELSAIDKEKKVHLSLPASNSSQNFKNYVQVSSQS